MTPELEELLKEAKAEIAELKLLLKLADAAGARAREYNARLVEEAKKLTGKHDG